MTTDAITECILSLYPSGLDKSKGSVLWDLCCPQAIALKYTHSDLTPKRIAEIVVENEFYTYLSKQPTYY